MEVWLQHYQRTAYDGPTKLGVKHPLVRRLTYYQQSIVHAIVTLQRNMPLIWSYFKENENIPIFFATQLGEIDASISLSQQILAKDYPLSPKDFQNSVYNGAMGAISIIFDFHNGYTAMSDGFLSMERALYLSFQLVKCGAYPAAIVIHGLAYKDSQGQIQADTELVVLSQSASIEEHCASHRFANIELVQKKDFESLPRLTIEEGSCRTPWLNWDQTVGQERLAFDRTGEGVLIQWK